MLFELAQHCVYLLHNTNQLELELSSGVSISPALPSP